MKIAFLTRSLEYGGAERQLTVLASELARRGHTVEVGIFYPGGPLESELNGGVTVRRLHKKGRYETVRFLRRVRRWLREFRPEIAHGYLVAPNLALALLKGSIRPGKLVWGVRASYTDFDRFPKHEGRAFRFASRLASRADRVVANSEAGARYHIEQAGYPAETMQVVPNGIDLDRFRPDPEAGARFRAERKIPADAVVIGMVGRLDPMKGYERFLEAAAITGHHFLCVGSGPASYERELRHRATGLGLDSRLTWAPFQDDPAPAYAAMNLLCSCSTGEGFPNVVAEAMACGVPCAVTDVGDSARIVGELGEGVPPDDPQAMAAAWARILRSPPARTALRRSIQERFSLSRMVDATERLYLELRDHD